MTKWLLHRFIHDADNTGDQRVRGAYGTLASCVGICINLLLALTKFLVGIVTGSVAVTADAANNLSDAGGSIVSLVSVRMAQKPAASNYPRGRASSARGPQPARGPPAPRLRSPPGPEATPPHRSRQNRLRPLSRPA